MIWRLLKRDFIFKSAPVLAVLLSLTASMPGRLAIFAVVTLQMAFLGGTIQSGRRSFDATLPISIRDLWLSNVFAVLTLIWLPALAMAIVGARSLIMLEAAAVITIPILAVNLRIPALGAVPRLQAAPLLIALAGLIAMTQVKGISLPGLPSPAVVFSACGLAGVALCSFAWMTAPKSLQFAAVNRRPAEADSRSAAAPPTLPWLLLLRSSWEVSELLVAIPLIAFLGTPGLMVTIANPVFFPLLVSKSRWLLPLPVSPHKLFASIALPPGVALAGGCVGNFYLRPMSKLGPITPREALADFAVELTCVYLILFVFLLAYSRWFSGWPVWLRWAPLATLFFPLFFALAFPQSFALPLPMLAAPVAVSYLLAQFAFAAREFRPRYIETHNIPSASR